MWKTFALPYLRFRLALRDFLADERGQDLVEYITIVGALLVLVAGLVWAFGARLAELWQRAIDLLR